MESQLVTNVHCTCPDFLKMPSWVLGKKGKWVYYKYLYYVFRFLCKVGYKSDKFIHALTPHMLWNKNIYFVSQYGVIPGGGGNSSIVRCCLSGRHH